MNIVFDLDEILCNFTEPFLEWYNKEHGTNFKREEWTRYRFHDAFGVNKEYERKEFLRFNELCLSDLPIVSGSKEGVIKLKERGNNLNIVTARSAWMHPNIEDMTKLWVEKNFPNCFKEILWGHYESKLSACLKVGADIIIEDNFHFVSECAEHGIRAILFDCPWNKKYYFKERVYNWEQIVQKVRSSILH